MGTKPLPLKQQIFLVFVRIYQAICTGPYFLFRTYQNFYAAYYYIFGLKDRPTSIAEFEWAFKKNYGRKPNNLFGNSRDIYLNYVCGDGKVYTACRKALDSIRLLPRIMRDVSKVDIGRTVHGTELSMPVIIAPMSSQSIYNDDAEAATARANASAGTMFSYNFMLADTPYREVCAIDGSKWLHLYIYKDRTIMEDALRLIESCQGKDLFRGIVLTCDHPHERSIKFLYYNYYSWWWNVPIKNSSTYKPNQIDLQIRYDTCFGEMISGKAPAKLRKGTAYDEELSWDIIAYLKSRTNLPIVAKGILLPEDAELAIQASQRLCL
jgi:isopentenyl diphosphate isomerase/L-lactate dehydrogenase-like FMN-dependent dehydrogenase